MPMSYELILEIIAVVFGLLYLILLIKENIWCWAFGIVGSGLSIFLFVETKLYSEAILYGYYVVIGIYGWWLWNRPKAKLLISKWNWFNHVIAVAACAVLSLLLGYGVSIWTDADKPYFDATTSIFSYFASYLEAKKILSSWVYWIFVNLLTIGLYNTKDLSLYSGLMAIYFVLSIVGYIKWMNAYKLQ